MAVNTSTKLRNQVIYSIYVRNYSKEGTFAAVERDLDRIQNLGVDIIWFLPIYPIGEINRKGTLGSPYAIADYRKVNPELGTMEDFRHLVKEIHSRGIKCMLDIVYNHTSPDSWLVKNHPEYFYKSSEGKMGNRIGDWTDVVDLDYNNGNLWQYQIDTLKMWAQIVDGFRCDVAPLIPLRFWLKARAEVAEVNPECIWLSESVDTGFIMELRSRGLMALSDSEILQAFDICYDYDIYRFFHSYLMGEGSLSKFVDGVNMQECIYPSNYVKLRFLENHDQKRARNLIESENALINWTAFLYFQKGAALLYAGQENQNIYTPSLFEKDIIDLSGHKDFTDVIQKLYNIKKLEIMADSSYHLTAYDELDVIVGVHRGIHSSEELVGIFSLGEKKGSIDIGIPDGVYTNLVNGKELDVRHERVELNACPVVIRLNGKQN